jgi:hypothetical protein
MVIEGIFHRARYADAFGEAQENVILELYMTSAEKENLQNALMNRRMDTIQMVINTAAVEQKPATPDTPSTTSESW